MFSANKQSSNEQCWLHAFCMYNSGMQFEGKAVGQIMISYSIYGTVYNTLESI